MLFSIKMYYYQNYVSRSSPIKRKKDDTHSLFFPNSFTINDEFETYMNRPMVNEGSEFKIINFWNESDLRN